MAFEDIRRLLEEQRSGLSDLESRLQDAIAHRNKAQQQLDNARRRWKRKTESPVYPNRLRDKFKKDLLAGNLLENELIFAIDRAIETNIEFEQGVYKTQLYKVAKNKDIYKLIFSGDGWNTVFLPQIVFEESAGGLQDWARGIELYRDVLGTNVDDEGVNRGRKATQFWYTKVWGTRLESRTIQSRIDLSGREAPFWQILNSGSQPLASDRPDGSYNPLPATATNFIGEAERSIKVLFNVSFLGEKVKWFQEAQALRKEIEELEQIRDDYSDDVDLLRADVKLNQAVYNRLGKKNQYVDRNKLAEAIRKYRAGEEFERPTIELTRPGSERRVRISVRQLEGFIDY